MEEKTLRPIWSGTISFVLINIPVRLYSASEERSFGFNLLHKKDNSRIRYARYCEIENKEIPYDEIVKGYEYQKGQFVIIEKEDFEKADPKRSKSIELVDFVKEEEIDPIYYGHPYFLDADSGADKSFNLLKEALEKTKKVAVGKMVFHEKEHLLVVRPYKEGLLLQQLKFAHEIRPISALEYSDAKPAANELELAIQLIEKLTGKFQIEKFKDDYYETMQKIIDQKAKGQTVYPLSAEPEPTEFADLMAKLKESLDKTPTK